MTRTILLTIAALMAAPALAAELPFSGAYGSAEDCARYTAGGTADIEFIMLKDRTLGFGACAYTAIEDRGDIVVVKDGCGQSFDLVELDDRAALVVLEDGHEYALHRCQ